MTGRFTIYVRLRVRTCLVGLLHGDMSQVERNEVITGFKHKSTPILAATDVAGMTHNRPIYLQRTTKRNSWMWACRAAAQLMGRTERQMDYSIALSPFTMGWGTRNKY